MTTTDFSTLLDEVSLRQTKMQKYLFAKENALHFSHVHLQDAVYSYLRAGGKSLRPAVLMFACGAVGGKEDTALPAASAIELYHTFTLVHDDIIDKDELRRGVPTVHADFARRAQTDLGYDRATAEHYGLSVAILAGDLQIGWAASLLTRLYSQFDLSPVLALNLTADLFGRVQATLIEGETLDLALSGKPLEQVKEEQVLEMIWQKTGVLYEFAGRAGAAIGLNQPDFSDPMVDAIAKFTGKCGIAFQIQDDILGVTGNEAQLGKPVGSDIREGKRTLIVLNSIKQMNDSERALLMKTLGNHNASQDEIKQIIALLRDKGGVEYTLKLARQYVTEALEYLREVPDTPYKRLLETWATYMIEREF